MALWPKPTFLLEFRKHGTTFRKAGQGHHHSRATSERRRFSPPWSVDEQEACFIVRDANIVRWYRKAADQGDAYAQSLLAISYRDGKGIPQDYVQAHKWFNLAVSQLSPTDKSRADIRNSAERGRESVASKMTPAQIAQAQKLAREWKPKPER